MLPVQILLGTSKLYVGGCVEYIKGQHLYRTLELSAHFLLSFCVRIGAFDRSHVFMLVQVFFLVSCTLFIGVRVQRTNVDHCG